MVIQVASDNSYTKRVRWSWPFFRLYLTPLEREFYITMLETTQIQMVKYMDFIFT